MPTAVAVVGFDDSTWDFVITLPRRRALTVLGELGFPADGVHYVRERDRVVEAIDMLRPLGRLTRAPGGPVSNTLAAMAALGGGVRTEAGSGRPGLELCWAGRTGRVGDYPREPVGSPLDSLRRLSITTWVTWNDLAARDRPTHRATLCLIDEATRETFLILVEDAPALAGRPELPAHCDVIILTFRDLLARLKPEPEPYAAGGRFALIVGDGVRLDSTRREALGELADSGTIGWVFGTFDELNALGLLTRDSSPAPLLGAEVVATCGASPVRVYLPDAVRAKVLDVPALPRLRGNDLGAGDAYAGGYLFGRLSGKSVAAAHKLGLSASRQVLEADAARAAYALSAADTIALCTERDAVRDDVSGLFDRVHATNGLSVVCGGQTGVDQLGLAAAADLGLPAFCVLPDGRRTEVTEGLAPGPDEFYSARIEVLGSPSYRYRTWATAYLADGTLLWDFRDSEGSRATKDACAAFGRPLLDLVKIEPCDRIEAARRWARRHDVRVVNVAGNRGSFLSSDERALARQESIAVLRALAYDRADDPVRASNLTNRRTTAIGSPATDLPLRIGVSSATAQRRLFTKFLAESYGVEIPAPPALTAAFERPALDVVFARAHDIPAFVQEGAIDVGICGSDVVHGLSNEIAVVMDTGLFPLLVVLVGRAGTDLSADPPPGGWRLGSQYGGRFADRLGTLPALNKARAIGGTAESWLALGQLDLAIDTWKTGATAETNGVALLEVLLGTSLVVVAPAGAEGAARPELSELTDRLGAWLAGSRQMG